MTLHKFAPIWKKLTQQQRLLIGSGAVVALATLAAIGISHAAEDRTTSRLGGIEVSQDKSSYVVTIPDAQDSRARLDGRTLQVRTRDQATGLQSEQSIALPDADLTRDPQVSRKDGSLVVTVPKSDSTAVAAAATAAAKDPLNTSPFAQFDQDVFARMEQMQRQMDAMFGRAFADMPGFDAMPGRNALSASPAAGINLNLQDKGKNYVVRAENLDPKKQNINVAVDNDRVLRITAQQEDSAANRHEVAHFTQAFTLPGPVKASEMKVDQQDGALVITLPKA